MVLQAIKEPNMYLTLAALRFDGSNQAEYIAAGHISLLHYRQQYQGVIRHSMYQLPVGLFAGTEYESRYIPYEAGDVFALVTDGMVELGEDRDTDLGFERLAAILQNIPGHPLPDIGATVRWEVERHGTQQDDQTVLLVRRVADEDRRDDADSPRVREATWRKLLDELAAELTSE